MHSESRATLAQDLAALRICGRDRLDTLSLFPRTTPYILQVMAYAGDLELIFPSNGNFDVIGLSRFCAFALRRRLRPRFEWWGNLIAVRVTLGGDVEVAIAIIDACFGSVFHVAGPYALEFNRMGWESA